MIIIGKMSRLSFHDLGKTSHKIPKIVREISIQVSEQVRNSGKKIQILVGTLQKITAINYTSINYVYSMPFMNILVVGNQSENIPVVDA